MSEAWLADLIGPRIHGDRDHGPGIARVLWLRYCGPSRRTLRAVGAELGLSATGVRQREGRGLRMLRYSGRRAAFVATVPPDHRLALAAFHDRAGVAAAYAALDREPEE